MGKRCFVTQRLFDDTVERAFHGSEIEVVVRDADEPLDREELIRKLNDYQAVVSFLTDRLDTSVLEANPQLEVVANVAVGYDNIDVSTAERLGIAVTHTPNVLTESTADFAMALMLAVARRVPEADAYARSGGWTSWKLRPPQIGVDLYGKTLGLFGMGRIGRAVARRAVHGFSMRLLYTSPHSLSNEEERALGARNVALDELLASVDVLSLHAPLTPETRHVIGAEQLARMQPHAMLINTARGSLVDEAALADALAERRIWGAGLDVFEREPKIESELIAMRDRVVLAPHVASATEETRRLMAEMAALDVRAVLEGRSPRHVVVPLPARPR